MTPRLIGIMRNFGKAETQINKMEVKQNAKTNNITKEKTCEV